MQFCLSRVEHQDLLSTTVAPHCAVTLAVAVVACVRGCECAESTLDGHWTFQVSQNNGHYITVTPHPECVLRVTVLNDTTSGERKVRP